MLSLRLSLAIALFACELTTFTLRDCSCSVSETACSTACECSLEQAQRSPEARDHEDNESERRGSREGLDRLLTSFPTCQCSAKSTPPSNAQRSVIVTIALLAICHPNHALSPCAIPLRGAYGVDSSDLLADYDYCVWLCRMTI